MKKGTIFFRDGKVIIVFPDRKFAIIPTRLNFPQDIPEEGEECSYFKKGSKLQQIAFRNRTYPVDSNEIIIQPNPEVQIRIEIEEQKKKEQEAIEQARLQAQEAQETSKLPSIENGRVNFIYESLEEVSPDNLKSYSDTAKNAWMLVRRHTIGPAFAFIDAQKVDKPIYKLLHQHFAAWLSHENCLIPIKPSSSSQISGFILDNPQLNSMAYRKVSMEALAFFQWAARLAEGKNKD